MVKLKTCKDHAIKAGLGRNWLGWGGRLPPPRCRVQSAASSWTKTNAGKAAVCHRHVVVCRAPLRGRTKTNAGEAWPPSQRRCATRLAARPGAAVSSSAAWLPKRPAGVGPPEPLPPLQLDLDVPDGKFVNKPYSYSIDLNLATRMTRAYDVG